MKKWGLLLLATTLLAACNDGMPVAPSLTQTAVPSPVPAAPTVIPTPVPTATPVPPPATATPVVAPTPTALPLDDSDIRCAMAEEDTAPPEIGDVVETLGYAFNPTTLPDGFELAGASFGDGAVRQTYQYKYRGEYRNIIIAYPLEFSPKNGSGPLGWERPVDAVSALRIGDQTAYLMTGGWSDLTLLGGPALNPKEAEWDYDKSLALFFTCRSEGGRAVEMAIQALPGPIDWISVSEIVDIAHSLRRVSDSQ